MHPGGQNYTHFSMPVCAVLRWVPIRRKMIKYAVYYLLQGLYLCILHPNKNSLLENYFLTKQWMFYKHIDKLNSTLCTFLYTYYVHKYIY